MEIIDLRSILAQGEDTKHQFKQNIHNVDSLAGEFVAFSNGDGGQIFVGVRDTGDISGLEPEDIRRINQLVSNAASQSVRPAINPKIENIATKDGLIMVVTIAAGLNKPYQDKNGVFWVKSGTDKRKATSREEIQRMFQRSNLLHADEMLVQGLTMTDLDLDYFEMFFQKRFGYHFNTQNLPLQKILENMNILNEGFLNVAGALLFAKTPQYKLPIFIVKASAFDANDLSTTNYNDNRNIEGKLPDIFQQTVGFIISNLRQVQGSQGVNSLGQPEIPRESIEEIVANALIHRDYFISSPVRVFVFRNRIEVISPGHLPNNLTIENIKSGNSVARNPLLASFANHILPYRGYGSGIIRALAKYPHIDFEDDRDGNLFKVTLKRNIA